MSSAKLAVLKCLVVEDDEDSAHALAQLLSTQGLGSETAGSLADAREKLGTGSFDLVLLDVQLPDGTGTDLLAELEAKGTDVVMISGQSTLDHAIAALRKGALDFLPKPLDMARLSAILVNLRRRSKLSQNVLELREKLRKLGRFGDMIGQSPQMQRIYECVERVAPTHETVMIIGPSGAGKELIASTIQKLSNRSDGPYITVNCGAISATLIESELFGHEKGAFTGADKRRKGMFELAHEGTLFLDEVTEMPIELQVRLLRVLETGRFNRVGGQEEIEVDVRLIAATNREPEEAVKEGRLRGDLLYRLLVFPIQLPPLRERDGDVPLLAQYFLDQLDEEYESRRTLTSRAVTVLNQHAWPGNVRELYNTMRRAYIMTRDEIDAEDLLLSCGGTPLEELSTDSVGVLLSQPTKKGDGCATSATAPKETAEDSEDRLPIFRGMSIAESERVLINATLETTKGNKAEAAEILGISLKTLYTRLQVYSAMAGQR